MEALRPEPYVPYRQRLAADIGRCRPDEEEQLFVLRRSTFGAGVQLDPGYLHWQIDCNPNMRPDARQLFVCRRDDRIVGQQAGIPVRIKIGPREYRASWACDLVVDRGHRMRGIGAMLAERHHMESDVTLGLSISDEAHRTYGHSGWLDLGTLSLFVRPLSVRTAVRALGADLCARVTRHVKARADTSGGWPARLELGRCLLTRVTRFSDSVDALWDEVSCAFPVICRRDRAYLNWRYSQYPDPNRYSIYLLHARGRLIGWAVLRLGRRHALPVGYIVDYFCAPETTRAVFAASLQALDLAGAAVAYCRHQSPFAAAALWRLGFVRRDSGCRMMARGRNLPGHALRLLQAERALFVTAGDSDADQLKGDG